MERSAIRDSNNEPPTPDFAALHPGYDVRYPAALASRRRAVRMYSV
jgi:hypothetical protein